LSHIGQNILSI
jgi:hypothetical protein